MPAVLAVFRGRGHVSISSVSALQFLFPAPSSISVSSSLIVLLLAWVAQLDARMTEDQEVVGSTPTGSATFFHGD